MRHLSLFSGSGIGTLAANEAGIVTVAHAENDPACCYCLERLWPGVRLFRDVRDVTAESVADLGPIDIISGGFPCQDVSTAGKGEGLGTEENPTRSGLWYEFARVIRETRPRYVLVENVPALRLRGADRVLADLEAEGYTCWTNVVGAWAVGAPHKRDRVWIVGRRLGHADDSSTARQPSKRWASEEATGRLRNRLGDTGISVLADPIGNLCGRGGDESERGPEGRTAAGRAGEAVENPARDGQRGEPATERANGERTWQSGDERGELADSNSPRLPQSMCQRSDPREEQQAAIGSRWPSGSELAEPESCGRKIKRDWRDNAGSGPGCDGPDGDARRSSTGQDDLRVWGGMDGADGQRSALVDAMPIVQADSLRHSDLPVRWPSRPGEPQHDWEATRLVEFGVGDAVDGLSRRVRQIPSGVLTGVELDAVVKHVRRASSRANKAALRMVGNAWCYQVVVLIFKAIVELDDTFRKR